MKNVHKQSFFGRLYNKKEHYPWCGQFDLTYRCNFNCVHCYCAGSGKEDKELSVAEWKKIIDEIHKEGCFQLCFSGGDPLIKEDFLEIYSYAKKKAFIVTIFTNGYGFTEQIIDHLVKSPPYSIEITLNGITKDTYEAITQVPGSFAKVIENIRRLAENKLSFILKSNCLKQNKHEIGKIKAFTEDLLGKQLKNEYNFKYDPMIFPRLNADKTPCEYRLSPEELLEVKKQDPDIWGEYQKGLHADLPDLQRGENSLYICNSWMSQFFVNPYGRIKFCQLSDKFSADLKTMPFKQAFYSWPAQILNQRFKTDSKCRNCNLRILCYHCPSRAYLETGSEESPVEYYCQLVEDIIKQRRPQQEVMKNEKFALR